MSIEDYFRPEIPCCTDCGIRGNISFYIDNDINNLTAEERNCGIKGKLYCKDCFDKLNYDSK